VWRGVWNSVTCDQNRRPVSRPMTHLRVPSCIMFIESRKSALRIYSTHAYRMTSPGCHIPWRLFKRRPLRGIQEPDTWKETISGAACSGYAGGRTISRSTGGSDDRDKWCSCDSAFPLPVTKTSIGRSSSTGTSNFNVPFEVSLETQSG
jgi:hypothetical protein